MFIIHPMDSLISLKTNSIMLIKIIDTLGHRFDGIPLYRNRVDLIPLNWVFAQITRDISGIKYR